MNIGFDPSKFQEHITVDQFTKMPNVVIDEYMAQLPDKAYKCYSLILRRTIGFQVAYTQIATTEFKKYCDIKKDETVYKHIRTLEQMGLIKVWRTNGEMNTYQVCKLEEIKPKNTPLPTNGTTPIKGDGTTPIKGDGTTPVERGSIKENFKENIKETHTTGADEIFELWKPDLHTVNSWLQRSGEKPMTQQQFDEFKISFLSHYANRIQTGLINHNQLFGKMVSWIKGDYSKYRKSSPEKHQTKKSNRWNEIQELIAKEEQGNDSYGF